MSKYLISVDGGGTGTQVCVHDVSDQSKAFFSFEGSNYHSVGIEKFEKVFVDGFNEIYEALSITKDDIIGAVFGLSGCDTEVDKNLLIPAILKTGLDREKIFLCNDCELIMYSVAKTPGICIVSGTGSIAFAYDKSLKTIRCGGWGNPLSDLGSGFWIGMQILREYIKYTDEQVPYLPVYDEIEKSFGLTRDELLIKCTQASKKEIASVARLTLEAAENGNPLCESILKAAAFNLANMCSTLYKKLDKTGSDSVDIVMTGSVFKNNMLVEQFKEQCVAQSGYDKFNFIPVEKPPVEYGIDFAERLFYKN